MGLVVIALALVVVVFVVVSIVVVVILVVVVFLVALLESGLRVLTRRWAGEPGAFEFTFIRPVYRKRRLCPLGGVLVLGGINTIVSFVLLMISSVSPSVGSILVTYAASISTRSVRPNSRWRRARWLGG